MIKQTVAAILLLLVLLGLGFWAAGYVEQTVRKTEALLNQAVNYQQAGQDSQARILLTQAADHWRSKESALEILLRHDDVETVLMEFARLQSYAATIDEDDFLSNCYGLLAVLQHIREMEWPAVQNIL